MTKEKLNLVARILFYAVDFWRNIFKKDKK